MFIQPTEFTGLYPQGWAGYTFLDYDQASNTFHPGDDYNWGTYGDADLGKAVVATAKGTCIYSGSDTVGYGNMIVLSHKLNDRERIFIKHTYNIDTVLLYSLYGHLQERMVAVGNTVDSGSLIGRIGKSGTQYAHLHFEIYAPIGELANKPWRFYPVGWSKEQIKKYWLPPFLFINAYKNFMDSGQDTTNKDDQIKALEAELKKIQNEMASKLAQKDVECQKKLQDFKNKILDCLKTI